MFCYSAKYISVYTWRLALLCLSKFSHCGYKTINSGDKQKFARTMLKEVSLSTKPDFPIDFWKNQKTK
jgi:hypothetical protein